MKNQRMKNEQIVVIVGRKGGGMAKKQLTQIGYENIIVCNNLGKSDCEGVFYLKDVLENIDTNGCFYTIFILLPAHYHFQVLQQIERSVHNKDRIKLCYESDLRFQHANAMKNRNDLFSYKIVYSDFIDRWTDNLMSEVHFWEFESLTEGHRCFGEALQRNSKELFECNRIKVFPGCRVLDIGCGCLYKWGNRMPDGEYIPMDPLAYYYNFLYKNWRFANDLRQDTVFGMFEYMSLFVEGKVDYVIIDNAIDHCIDPFKAVIEALKVLKTGGVLSIYTYENESVNAMESGLHNWNLSLNQNDELLIWNIDNFVNVTKYLSDYVEFEILEDETWFHPAVGEHRTFAVNMRKKREIHAKFYDDNLCNLADVISSLMKLMASNRFYNDLKKVIKFESNG